MARPLRIEYPRAVYHITSRGNEKKAIFKDDEDRPASLIPSSKSIKGITGYAMPTALWITTITY